MTVIRRSSISRMASTGSKTGIGTIATPCSRQVIMPALFPPVWKNGRMIR
jgi:hypothetical protein